MYASSNILDALLLLRCVLNHPFLPLSCCKKHQKAQRISANFFPVASSIQGLAMRELTSTCAFLFVLRQNVNLNPLNAKKTKLFILKIKRPFFSSFKENQIHVHIYDLKFKEIVRKVSNSNKLGNICIETVNFFFYKLFKSMHDA